MVSGRDQGVAQRVPQDHPALGHPLRPRRADVVLAEHFQQTGAGEAHDRRQGGKAERDRRQQDPPERIPKSVAHWPASALSTR